MSHKGDEARRERRRENVGINGYMCRRCQKRVGRHLADGARLCCRCYVFAGHEPAEWHPECMEAAAVLGKTQR
jgi:hypothetical protein